MERLIGAIYELTKFFFTDFWTDHAGWMYLLLFGMLAIITFPSMMDWLEGE
jgi:hypothetical protein